MGHGLLLAALLLPASAAASPATLAVYKKRCQSCHQADGDSPLEPLNFADGKWNHGSRTADIARVITQGVPGTAMLPFKGQLTPEQIARLAAYVRSFARGPRSVPRARR